MQYEKIKIYVTKRVAQILEKDADIFDFVKKDGITPNKNALLTTLIVNFFDDFRQKQKELNNAVVEVLRDNTALSDEKVASLSAMIAGRVNKNLATDSVEKFDTLVSLKPTKESQPVIDYIEEYLLDNCSLSEYFRNMFVAYTAMPQDMRERIIFKENYEILSEAINKGKCVFLTTKAGNDNKIELMPYKFARSKEEIHIYLMYKLRNFCQSIKLSRIASVMVIDKPVSFDEKELQTFKRMLAYGPQFYYGFSEQEVKVRLTPQGQQLFRKIYVHRPIPKAVEGDIYTFDCSYSQLIQYFVRFSDNVEILSPDGVRDSVLDFHKRFVDKNTIK